MGCEDTRQGCQHETQLVERFGRFWGVTVAGPALVCKPRPAAIDMAFLCATMHKKERGEPMIGERTVLRESDVNVYAYRHTARG